MGGVRPRRPRGLSQSSGGRRAERGEGRNGGGPGQVPTRRPRRGIGAAELGRAPGHGAEARLLAAGRGGAAGPDGARALARCSAWKPAQQHN